MVLLVCIVENLVEHAASLEFVFNDFSLRVRVRRYLNGGNECGKCVPGQFVTMAGSVRTAPELHVSAQFVHMLESPDEVSNHLVESAHVALRLRDVTRRPVATPQALSPQKAPKAATIETPQATTRVALALLLVL